MRDLDTAMYLEEFKEKFYTPIKKSHEKYMAFTSMPEEEAKKADLVAEKYYFLTNFIASVEGTLEQNTVMRKKLEGDEIVNQRLIKRALQNCNED